ncbi:MAG: putative ribosome biogenesis GTPase RsgA [Planctomycetes bacterium]|nr:putative ribosome biogenesis GTPase RsgA [Planctomycetota bacterium]
MHPLQPWGWDAAWERAAASLSDLANTTRTLVRILEVRRDGLVAADAHVNDAPVTDAHVNDSHPNDARAERGDLAVTVPGRFRHDAESNDDFPAAGDFAFVDPVPNERKAVLRALLPRRSVLVRRFAGRKRAEGARDADLQVIVANVDHVFVLSSLDADFSPRRIERFLAQVWEGGAQPVVVLTKADLCGDVASRVAEAEAASPGVPVIAVAAARGEGLDRLAPFLREGKTSALVGSSGVGKSTLLNALFGRDVQLVRAMREHDQTGQHTTTSRRLFLVPGRGVVIDTPGMRELGLWHAGDGVSETFHDVEELGGACRFRDCTHRTEPGCAVAEAVAAGALDEERVAAWRHLQRELAFQESKERKRVRKLRGDTRRPDEGAGGGDE